MEATAAPAPDEVEDGLGPDEDTGDLEPDLEAEPVTEPVTEPAPEAEPETAAEPEPEATEAPEPETPDEPAEAETAAAEDTPPDTDQPAETAETEAETEEEEGPPPSVEGLTPPKRDLDQNLRAILQEEVAREMAARASETGPSVIETPPTPAETETPAEDTSDLELIREPSQPFDDDTFPDIGPAPTPERVDVFAAAPDLGAAGDKASRKDLFPDIEEINSTLDSHGLEDEDDGETDADERSGFSRAFLTVIAIAALLLALYLAAPKLAASVPALEPALEGYVGAINGIRAFFANLI